MGTLSGPGSFSLFLELLLLLEGDLFFFFFFFSFTSPSSFSEALVFSEVTVFPVAPDFSVVAVCAETSVASEDWLQAEDGRVPGLDSMSLTVSSAWASDDVMYTSFTAGSERKYSFSSPLSSSP